MIVCEPNLVYCLQKTKIHIYAYGQTGACSKR